MPFVNSHIYSWFISKKFPRLGSFEATKATTINIHRIVNMNATQGKGTTRNKYGKEIPLLFLKSQFFKKDLIRSLDAYCKQEESYYLPEGDPRRFLARRLARRLKKKQRKAIYTAAGNN